MKKIEDINYKNTGLSVHMLDIYLPDEDEFPVLVYFHGGGLERGDKAKNTFYPSICEKGIAVVTANYSLYPEAAYPDFIRDAAAAVSWAFNNMEKYGKITGFFVGGSSAGGYLSEMLCFDKRYLNMHGIDSDKLDGYIFDAGQPTSHFNVLKEKGFDSKRIVVDETAPLYHITDGRDYAPMLIFVSDNDIQNRYEQTQLLMSTLKHFDMDSQKIDYRLMENSTHCSYRDKQTEDGKWIFAEMISEFIYNSLKKA